MITIDTIEQWIQEIGENPTWESIAESEEMFLLEEDYGLASSVGEAQGEAPKSPFNEAGLLPVMLIRQGWSRNYRLGYNEKNEIIKIGRYYTAEAIASLAPFLAEKSACYIDHPSWDSPPRGMERWAAEIEKSEIKDVSGRKTAYAELRMVPTPSGKWMREVIEAFPAKVAMSLVSSVTAKRGKVAGREADIIQAITNIESNDFVRYGGIPGAGVRRGKESLDATGGHDKKIEKDSEGRVISYEIKGRKFYPSVSTSESFDGHELPTQPKEVEVADTKPTNVFELLAQFPELMQEHEQRVRSNFEKDNKAVQEVATLKADKSVLETKVTALEAERVDLKAKLDRLETEKALTDRKARVHALLAEADLNMTDAVQVSPVFLESLYAQNDEAKIKAMIDDRKVLVFSRASTGNGERKVEGAKTKTEASKEKVPMTNEQGLNLLTTGMVN